MSYSRSIRQRFRVLFSPLRLVLFLLSVVNGIVLSIVYMSANGQPEILGPLSAIPLLAFALWTATTDSRERKRERISIEQ